MWRLHQMPMPGDPVTLRCQSCALEDAGKTGAEVADPGWLRLVGLHKCPDRRVSMVAPAGAKHQRQLQSGVLVVALVIPSRASANDGEEEARAEALEREGRYAEAAEAWERAIRAAPDARVRMLASMHAVNAWLDAFAATGDGACRCAARSVLTRALADESIDERGRDEWANGYSAVANIGG